MRTLKVLFFAADPLSVSEGRRRLLLDKEAREIESEVVAALHRDNVEFVTQWATRIGDVRRALLRHRPQIVHFSGHGGSTGLVLEADDGSGPQYVGTEALEEFFFAFRDQIRVVVLNACYSEPQARAIANAVGCAIGTPDRIGEDAAIGFSKAFYSSIAFGKSVQAASSQARATLRMKDSPGKEIPELLVREDVDASQMVLIEPDAAPAPAPTLRRGVLYGAGALAVCGVTLFAPMIFADNPCKPAQEVQRAAQAANPSPAPRMGLLGPPAASGDPDDPLAGPPALAKARELHLAGDHATDFALYEQAAQAGSVEAMVYLGLAHIRGEGTPVQADSGLKWMRKAANTEDAWAMNQLGELYLSREARDQNLDHFAAGWFQKAAAKGHAEAMRNLGHLYRDGRGVERNGALALEWYAKAARAGFVDAMADVGWMYAQGGAVPRDAEQAFCWYRAAAESGSARGMMEQARIHERRGERRQARELYDKARQAGLAEGSPPAGRPPAP
jgi:TPR repeat protein